MLTMKPLDKPRFAPSQAYLDRVAATNNTSTDAIECDELPVEGKDESSNSDSSSPDLQNPLIPHRPAHTPRANVSTYVLAPHHVHTLSTTAATAAIGNRSNADAFDFDFNALHDQRQSLHNRGSKRSRRTTKTSPGEAEEEGEILEFLSDQMEEDGSTLPINMNTVDMDTSGMMGYEIGNESGGLGDFSPVFSFLSAQKESRRIKDEQSRRSRSFSDDNYRYAMVSDPTINHGGSKASTSILRQLDLDRSRIASQPPARKIRSTPRYRSLVSIPSYADSDLPINMSNADLNYDSVTSPPTNTPVRRDINLKRETMGSLRITGERRNDDDDKAGLPLVRRNYPRPPSFENQATQDLKDGLLELLRHQALASLRASSTTKPPYSRLIPAATSLNGATITAALPLSGLAKGRSLPRKLEAALPDDETLFANSARLYSPALLSNTGVIPVGTGPVESTLHGFWAAPPPLNTGELD